MTRCVNIDWLEVYAHEIDKEEPRDAEYFRALGYSVIERDYGTRIYEQMFTILTDHGEGFIEVRRLPKGLKTTTGFSVLDEGSCHLRLCNRTCYYPNAAQIMIDFAYQHRFVISRVARIDLCLDFAKFDTGDDPQKFLYRYINRKYSKINQGDIALRGKDMWDGRFWNSLAWGSPKSMVRTKLYNKTMELQQKHDKPYIRQAWLAAGLIDNFSTGEKYKSDGTTYTPAIWRLEFSITSSVKRWYVVEDNNGEKKRLRSIHNTLEDYTTKDLLMKHFEGLVYHYFHFKKFVEGQRKDRCPDKPLFRFDQQRTYYEVEHIAAAKPSTNSLESLRNRLTDYIARHESGDTHQAALTLLRLVDEELLRKQAGTLEARNEIILLQTLIARRLKSTTQQTLDADIQQIKALLTLESTLF